MQILHDNIIMNFLKFKKPTPALLGIDVSSNHINLVELMYCSNRYIVKSHHRTTLPDSIDTSKTWEHPTVANTLKQMLAEIAPHSPRTAIAFQENTVLIKILELDAQLKSTEILHYLTQNSQQLFNFSTHDLALDFEILGASKQNKKLVRVRCVAARRKQIEQCTIALKQLGLNLTIIDINCFCLQRLITTLHPTVAAFYCSGADILLIILDEGELVYSHTESVTSDQDLLQTLTRIFSIHGFSNRETPVSLILLAGDIGTENVASQLQAQTGVITETINPFASIHANHSALDIIAASKFAISIGLAMRVKP